MQGHLGFATCDQSCCLAKTLKMSCSSTSQHSDQHSHAMFEEAAHLDCWMSEPLPAPAQAAVAGRGPHCPASSSQATRAVLWGCTLHSALTSCWLPLAGCASRLGHALLSSGPHAPVCAAQKHVATDCAYILEGPKLVSIHNCLCFASHLMCCYSADGIAKCMRVQL